MILADIDSAEIEEVLTTDNMETMNPFPWPEAPVYKVIVLPNGKLRVILGVL